MEPAIFIPRSHLFAHRSSARLLGMLRKLSWFIIFRCELYDKTTDAEGLDRGSIEFFKKILRNIFI